MKKTFEELIEYYEQRIKNEPGYKEDLIRLSENEKGCSNLSCVLCPLNSLDNEYKCYEMMYAYGDRWTTRDMWKLAKRILADVNVDDGFWIGGFE